MFMLPDTWAPAGATPIGSVRDLLALGRTHLARGLSPSGQRVLSHESIARMQSVSHDMGTVNVSPLGLGWPLVPFGSVIALSHSGASPGGVAILVVVPEKDLVFAAFGNDIRALALHDRLLLWLLREYMHIEVPDLVSDSTPVNDLTPYAGTYRSNQVRVEVSVVGDQLEEKLIYEPLDAENERIFSGFSGGSIPSASRRFVPIQRDLFAPVGMPLQTFSGYSRQLLVSYHGHRDGRPHFRCAGGRMTRRGLAH
jgi:hypothetical protein